MILRGMVPVFVALASVAVGAGAATAIDIISYTGNPDNICAQQPSTGTVSNPGVCRTDNSSWTYYMDSSGEFMLEPEDRAVTTNGMEAWDNATVVTASLDSSPTFSGNAETDVIFQEGKIPGFPDWVDGATWCEDRVNGTDYQCDQHYVRIRGAGVYSKWLVAHESGHSLGLVHGTEAQPPTTGTASVMGIMTTGSLPSSLGATPIAKVDGTYN
ncbi:exported hypothetical protein [metagenome]|uniref:Peptidase M10 metallopeptidase domain-containing protein n=1 Tax=metagenome TaxID=256318 RepID=A0A2P2BYS7_9ZZZZ